MFIPLRKVDAARRLVYAQIDETPDRVGEVFDYATSKPNFEAWSGEMRKASDGKSLGNVRAMHGKVACGRLIDIGFDDLTKRIEICAHIVDDDEWAKVEAGVYTGVSPGGKYAKRWKDGQYTRYTAMPSELSIVDRPCIPTATFTMVKADGVAEERRFTPDSSDLEKGLYAVGRFAAMIASLTDLAASAAAEAGAEQDGSAIPARLRDWLAGGIPILADMAGEESAEAVAALSVLVAKLPDAPSTPMQLADGAGDLAKAGARHSKADRERLQAIHDHAVGMGAACSESGGSADKADDGGDLAKVQGDLASARDDLTRTLAERDDLARRVEALERLPAPGGPALKALEKAADVVSGRQSDPANTAEGQSFAERLCKIQAMPPGDDKRLALVNLAKIAVEPKS